MVAQIDITDEAAFAEYRSLVPATVEQYGGRYIIRGGAIEALEGEWPDRRLTIIEFPDVAALKRWHGSDEYRPLKGMRERSAISTILAVEGV